MNIDTLRQLSRGAVLVPGSRDYDDMRHCWNTSIDLHPSIIVVATSAADVQAAVRFASEHAIRVLVQSTGHGATSQTGDYLMVVTTRMNRVAVDAAARTVRIEAGAVWGEVLKESQRHGLAPLLGSSGTVGVVGYTLGGGIGWLTRAYGLALDSVLSLDVVTADGAAVRASPRENPDLFWALCGGCGAFGIVASVEMRLYPVTNVWGGSLTYPIADAVELFSRYREWTSALSEAMTSSIAIVNFPDAKEVPAKLRGTSAVVIHGCFAGPVDAGKALTAQWTEWRQPLANTFAEMSFADVASISKDPEHPVPAFGTGGDVFMDLSDSAIAVLVRYASTNAVPGGGKSPFLQTEIRHVDSRAVREPRVPNSIGVRDARYLLHVVASAPTPESIAELRRYADAFKQELRPHTSRGLFLSFADSAEALRADNGLSSETLSRLRAIKTKVDASDMFLSSHPIP